MLPKDPVILLSYVNTRLRDSFLLWYKKSKLLCTIVL